VVAVARKGEASIAQVAKDFGVSESCLQRWLKLDDIEAGKRPGVTSGESAELRELKKRNRLLEQEVEDQPLSQPQANCVPLQMYPLVLELAATVENHPPPVSIRVWAVPTWGASWWAQATNSRPRCFHSLRRGRSTKAPPSPTRM
jgi:transposase